MLIIAVVVAVTIGITKAKLDNIVSYTYYNAYSTLRKISTEMLADWDPQDPEYRQALQKQEFHYTAYIKNNILSIISDLWSQPAFAKCAAWALLPGQSCVSSGGQLCNPEIHNEDGCFACCTLKSPSGGNRPGGSDRFERCTILGASTSYECNTMGGYWCVTRAAGCKINAGTCYSRVGCASCVSCRTCNKSCDSGYFLDEDSCTCKCARICPSGYTLNTLSCTCEKKVCINKPSRIPCGQSWDETNCRLTGTVKTCPSGYKLNESTCACDPLTTCWDGSQASSESACPPSVTCWDGSQKGSYSDCPPCTNKPDTIPCGQSWDESTCSLTGSAKTCPSGQHLNSSCNCISTCPANPGCGKICNNETGIISDLPGFSKECSDETYEWSEEQCKCIPSPRTLPRKGENFCKLFERHANIMSGSEVCSGSVISNGTTNFADKSPDITLRNGLRVYNMHTDARAISDLANNTQGGSYDGVPNTNSYGYTVYVDIDGSRGDSQLWSDVYPFYITLSGKIIPAYDTSNPEQSGGDSVRHMQVSVENENYNSGRRSIKWLAKSVPFKEGACIAGYVGDSTPYCKNGTSYTQAVECTSNINSFCRVKQIQPVKFFF